MMTDSAVGLESCGITRLEHGLAAVLDQHDLSFQDKDQLVFLLVPMTERRCGARLERGEIAPELIEPDRVAQALSLTADGHTVVWRRIAGAGFGRHFGDVDFWHGPLIPDGFAGFAEEAPPALVALHDEIDVGILHAFALGARADFEIDGVTVGAVDQTMGDAAAGLEAGGLSRLEHDLAVVLVQGQFTLEHINELILVLMDVAQRRRRVRLDASDIDAALGEPDGVADASLLAPGNDRREFLGV